MRDRDAEFARKREAYAKAEQRIAELDRIISRLYEDNVMGKLSDERFVKMSHDYSGWNRATLNLWQMSCARS
ncbi:MAG: hypothetical protein ACLVHV_15610 [Oscillospiraceae bacterium]